MLKLGEVVPFDFRPHPYTVTETDLVWLPRMRDYLLGVARGRATVTYGQMKTDLEMPHAPNGLGRLLDLLSEECRQRKEPSLASLVVNKNSGEVGTEFYGDAAQEREKVYRRWPR